MRSLSNFSELRSIPVSVVSRAARTATLLTMISLGAGCHDISGSGQLPAGIPDQNSLRTPAGAEALYRGAVALFQFSRITPQSGAGTAAPGQVNVSDGAFVDALLAGGMLTDELQPSELHGNRADFLNLAPRGDFDIDARQLPETGPSSAGGSAGVAAVFSPMLDNPYLSLQRVRGTASQAIGALAAYDTGASPALRGHLYALSGYAEILLADLYCSGVPLSTLDFDGDYTYRAGSTTADVYTHAVALFDTAVALSADSTHILNLARVGKGRALLNLGHYAEAAAAVHDVPDTFVDTFTVDWREEFNSGAGSLFGAFYVSVSDGEVGNGLPYRSANDPRTAAVGFATNRFGDTSYFPAKYGTGLVPSPVTVASGIEARLIEAEAALEQGNVVGWADVLNALRAAAITPALPALTPDSTTNATPATRIAVMFRERAAWLFLSAQRQGDLRRLIRHHSADGFRQDHVYPFGPYPMNFLFTRYGNDVTLPIPKSERQNPRFTGCLDRNA